MTHPALCANPHCRDFGQHHANCTTTGCRGCQPRPAAPGTRLCNADTIRLGRDAIAAAALWADLAQDLYAAGTNGGGGPTVNPHPSLSFDPAVAETRATIHHTLTAWCQLIHDTAGYELPERGWRVLPLPPGVHGPYERARIIDAGIDYLGAHIHLHARWLAAHELAAEACTELAALVGQGRRRQDHNRTGVVHIGPCPADGCDGTLRGIIRRYGDTQPSEAVCDADQPHRWTGEAQIADLGRTVGVREGWPTARDIGRRYGRPIGTVHRLASERRWRRTEDGQRPTLYHPDDVLATMTALTRVAA